MAAGKKLTQDEFIARAKKIHGDKYDYSKVEYVNNHTKVTIICPEHGPFQQTPSNHLRGKECPHCGVVARNKTRKSRTTLDDFIKQAKKVHGDKYDYSKVVYNGKSTKVCIICPEHGPFWQTPSKHLCGQGCKKCHGNFQMTTEEFIARAREVHGDKYDYSKVEYVNAHTKVCIICPEHGPFRQVPYTHLNGSGCPKCIHPNAGLTLEGFIAKAMEIHGDRYDYSKVVFTNMRTPVRIICPEHGEFWQTPSNHLMGRECPKCTDRRKTIEEFIARAREVHGYKYDYSKVEYINNSKKVCIICPEHGEFWQTPQSHLRGAGCLSCSGNKKMTAEEFIAKAHKVHGDKYDYSKVEYKNNNKKVCIICPEHGEFWQAPSKHLAGRGCPNCKGFTKEYKFNLLQEFENEYAFRAFLANNDINILQVILRNVEPKFEPLKRDIERALANANEVDPIQSLKQKYGSDSKDENETEKTVETATETTTINTVDLDDDDAVNAVLATESDTDGDTDSDTEPSIEEVVRNNEQELQVINRIEHTLTPEDREYIMEKFLNDKRRVWMVERENKLNK